MEILLLIGLFVLCLCLLIALAVAVRRLVCKRRCRIR